MNPERRAALSAIDIALIVIGGIIGVGIFFTPAVVAERTGSATGVLAAWGIGAVLALLGGLTFCGLAARLPRHGGTFVYLREAFGPLPAFLYGWTNLLVIQSGALAVVAIVMVDHLAKLAGTDAGAIARSAMACGAILLFSALNYFGLRVGKRVQNVITALKLFAVFALAGLAFVAGGGQGRVAAVPAAPAGLLAAMLPVVFSFGGWQHGSFVAGAARRPARDVPLGILLGVVAVAVAYLAINVSFLKLLGVGGMAASKTVAADACALVLGDGGGRVMALVVAVSAAGILNTICLAPPYVIHAMAEERLVPAWAGRLHPRFGGPSAAVLLQGGWASLLVLLPLLGGASGEARDLLLVGVVFADWVFYALAGAALLRLGAAPASGGAGAAPEGVFRVHGSVPLAFTVLASAVAVGALVIEPTAPLSASAVLAVGAGMYFVLRARA
jgi:APA family basic amino acid/polyamine antiporter